MTFKDEFNTYILDLCKLGSHGRKPRTHMYTIFIIAFPILLTHSRSVNFELHIHRIAYVRIQGTHSGGGAPSAQCQSASVYIPRFP